MNNGEAIITINIKQFKGELMTKCYFKGELMTDKGLTEEQFKTH